MRLHVDITDELEAFLKDMEQADARNTSEYVIARALSLLKDEEERIALAAQEEAKQASEEEIEAAVQRSAGPLTKPMRYGGPLRFGNVCAKKSGESIPTPIVPSIIGTQG